MSATSVACPTLTPVRSRCDALHRLPMRKRRAWASSGVSIGGSWSTSKIPWSTVYARVTVMTLVVSVPVGHVVSRRSCGKGMGNVPVLSEQMTDTLPKVSTLGSFLTMAFRFDIRRTPSARVTVTTIGSPSGMAATASDTVHTSNQYGVDDETRGTYPRW